MKRIEIQVISFFSTKNYFPEWDLSDLYWEYTPVISKSRE
jgi:hypothetical protein